MIATKRIAQRQPLSDFSDPSFPDLINRLYANRGIRSSRELDYSLKHLPKPDLLTGMQQACELLYDALLAQANVLIVGDYDVDGATSTSVVKQSLESFGFEHIAYFIPDRLAFGYGLSPAVVEVIQSLQPDLVITVDNGISSHDGVKTAHDYGMSVIVTDHHLPSDSLPEADAIINPNLPGDKFPAKKLAGVGVAFYLMLGFRAYLRRLNWFSEQGIDEPSMVDYLDLVALGTIADVVPFDYVNRLLVQQGMLRINHGKCCEGIKALAQQAQKPLSELSCDAVAFNIAPKINAAGRLDDMSVGVECLLAKSPLIAADLAEHLSKINEQRKDQESKSNDEAATQLVDELSQAITSQSQATICLYRQGWHPGIVGLMASRLKDKFNLPTIVFADDGELLKGSARSIKHIHMKDVLGQIDSQHPALIQKFGGHAMAAGLSLKSDDFDAFKSAYDQLISEQYSDYLTPAVIYSDGQLTDDQFSLETCERLHQSGPFGPEFESPQFDNDFEVIDCNQVGQSGYHLRWRLKLSDGDQILQAIAFNADRYLSSELSGVSQIHAVYRLDINRYNNSQQLQLVIDYFEVQ